MEWRERFEKEMMEKVNTSKKATITLTGSKLTGFVL